MSTHTKINVAGKSYNSWNEWIDSIKNDPNNTTLVWEYQDIVNVVDGKPLYDGTSKGKCFWKGKTYEGAILQKGNSLYVGGEYVKDLD